MKGIVYRLAVRIKETGERLKVRPMVLVGLIIRERALKWAMK